jgi:hypothetical protein
MASEDKLTSNADFQVDQLLPKGLKRGISRAGRNRTHVTNCGLLSLSIWCGHLSKIVKISGHVAGNESTGIVET